MKKKVKTMENRIEHEINKTLGCVNEDFDIQISPLFTEKLVGRIGDIRISRGIRYRNPFFYPVVIVLMILLNLAALMISIGKQNQVNESAGNQTSVIASEYGIGQNSYMNF